jgi:F-type H+-transporting ATPase subunit delta
MSTLTSKVSEPYAAALIDLAKANKRVEKTIEELDFVKRVFVDADWFKKVLEDPTIAKSYKKNIIRTIVDRLNSLNKQERDTARSKIRDQKQDEEINSEIVNSSIPVSTISRDLSKIEPTISPSTCRFLFLLIDRNRIEALERIIQRFKELAFREQSVVFVEVTSAISLNMCQRLWIYAILQMWSGAEKANLRVSYNTEPELIGGFIAKIESKFFDVSIRGELERITDYFGL